MTHHKWARVGQRALCVEGDSDHDDLRAGNYYTITRLSERAPTVQVAEAENFWWREDRFRPADPIDILIEEVSPDA